MTRPHRSVLLVHAPVPPHRSFRERVVSSNGWHSGAMMSRAGEAEGTPTAMLTALEAPNHAPPSTRARRLGGSRCTFRPTSRVIEASARRVCAERFHEGNGSHRLSCRPGRRCDTCHRSEAANTAARCSEHASLLRGVRPIDKTKYVGALVARPVASLKAPSPNSRSE